MNRNVFIIREMEITVRYVVLEIKMFYFSQIYFSVSHLTLSGNVKQFDTDGVNAIIFTCITSNVTERPVFTWINRTLDGDLLIENNMDIRQYNESYRQEFKFVPHWYQDKDKIACQVSNKNTNMTTTSNEEILSLKCVYRIKKSHLII